MKRTAVRAYCSPTLVLLARSPKSWPPNRVGFDGPPADGATKSPTIFTGSADMSEFMRLYEHYRARATRNRYMRGRVRTYTLSRDARWTGKAYKKATPEWRARVAMANG